MSMAETAKLAVDLSFKSNAGTVLGGVNRQLGTLDTSAAKLRRGFTTLGAGIGTAIRNGAVLAGAGITALVGLIAVSAKEGQAAAKVQTIYATAIGNSGKVSAAYVGILNAQQTALMNLAGVDDELIKSEQTRLIQMGLTGKAVSQLTPLILDASKATGKDLLTVTIAAGKAANGQATALSRLGIQVDKARFKIDPLAETVRVLNERFGGTVKALSENPDTKLDVRLGALRENLANIREESGIKLLPALTRIVDVVGKSLVPAFGKFVDRILPDISKGIDTFASALEGGGAEKAINGIADALGSMIDLLKIAAGPVKMIVSAFLALPKEVQGILVGGFAINKLSGGMIGQGLGQIAGGLIQRGGSPANPLFVADVTGGGGGAAGAAGGISKTFLVGTALSAAALVAALATVWEGKILPGLQAQADQNNTNAGAFITSGSTAELQASLNGLRDMPSKLTPLQQALYELNASGVKVHTEALEAALQAEIASRVLKVSTDPAVLRNERADALSAQGLQSPSAIASEGIQARAIAAGKDPSMATIAATLARNTTATVKAAAAASKTAAAVFAGAEKTGLRLLAVQGAINATTAAINAKQFTVSGGTRPVSGALYEGGPTTPVTVHVTTSPASARQNQQAATVTSRWGGGQKT